MLKFNLQAEPPSLAEIKSEGAALSSQYRIFRRRVLLCSTATITVSAVVVFLLWQTGLLSGNNAGAGAVAGALAVAVAGAVAGALAGAVAGAVAGALAGAGVFAVAGALAGAGVFAVAGAGAVAGAVAGAGAGAVAGAVAGIFVGSLVEGRLDALLVSIRDLEFLDDDSGRLKHRCEPAINACKSDELCRAYAAQVSAQGRSLTISEADMIEQWVSTSNSRMEIEEKERLQEIACVKLKNLHLTED